MSTIDTASPAHAPATTAKTATTTTVQVPGFDRTLEFEPGVRAVAVRNIPGTLMFFATHFPRQAILPGVLSLESMAALAAAAAGVPHATLRSVQRVKFHHFTQPGDQVVITVELIENTATGGDWRAEAVVDGRKVASARSMSLAYSSDSHVETA